MANFVHFLLLLFSTCVAASIKPECEKDNCEAISLILSHVQSFQNKMVSLMNSTMITQDKMVGILDRLEASIDKMNSHLENENHQINTMKELIGKVVDLLEHDGSTKCATLSQEVIIDETGTELYPAVDLTSIIDDTTTELAPVTDFNPKIHDTIKEMPAVEGLTTTRPITDEPSTRLLPAKDCGFIDNEGWTVFQRRCDDSLDFYRDWAEYENGFGDSKGEFWLGLTNIRRLISDGSNWTLRVDLESFEGESAYAFYDSFSISDAESNYTLSVGEYSGTAGDALKYTGFGGMHNGMAFATHDRDNKNDCATRHRGGWWYDYCYYANLNARYDRLHWNTWKLWKTLKSSQMKIRRVE